MAILGLNPFKKKKGKSKKVSSKAIKAKQAAKKKAGGCEFC